jgi:ketosteroid isomerase-like protein
MKALLICLLLITGPAMAAEDTSPEAAIRQALATWTEQFNARDTQGVCTLFAPGLRYNVEGLATEQTYQDMCDRLHRALTGREVTYHYRLEIQEIIVSGDIAVVRLVWYDTVSRPGVPDVVTPEQGMDIFRRQDDGSWKIIRYLAYSVQK